MDGSSQYIAIMNTLVFNLKYIPGVYAQPCRQHPE